MFSAFANEWDSNLKNNYTKKNQEWATLKDYKDHFLREKEMEKMLEEKYGSKKKPAEAHAGAIQQTNLSVSQSIPPQGQYTPQHPPQETNTKGNSIPPEYRNPAQQPAHPQQPPQNYQNNAHHEQNPCRVCGDPNQNCDCEAKMVRYMQQQHERERAQELERDSLDHLHQEMDIRNSQLGPMSSDRRTGGTSGPGSVGNPTNQLNQRYFPEGAAQR